MQLGSMPRWGCFHLFNNTGTLVTRGQLVALDPNDVSTDPQADVIVTEPYASPTDGAIPVLDLMSTANDSLIGGVALEDIPDDQAGLIMCYGACLADCVETADDAGGTAYGADETAGRLQEITPGYGATSAPVIAIQLGVSGSQVAAGQRLVFVNTVWGLQHGSGATPNPLGGA